MKPVPAFPDFRQVELDDRSHFENLFLTLDQDVSELNFTNLFMFKKVHDYMISELNGNTVVLARSYEGEPYFMPPFGDNDIPGTLETMFSYMEEEKMEPAVELAWKDFVDAYAGPSSGYAVEPDRDSFDYVYDTKQLIELPGRKNHRRKNLLNKFMKQYDGRFEYRRLEGAELLDGAIELVYRWCQERCTMDSLSTYGETDATMLALRNLDKLSTLGGVVLVDGNVEALSLGEPLGDRMVVIHVEKANSDFAGLYQYISSEFLRREFPEYPYTNREQDLGEPGLRKAKQSYNPLKMVEKFRIRPAG